MKALHYDGPFKTSIKEIARPALQHPDDVIVKVTTACICGSDLHMYQGRTAAQAGLVFGHENMGIVEELGTGVTLLKKGDRVVMPFNVADGRCRNCEEGKTAFCTGVSHLVSFFATVSLLEPDNATRCSSHSSVLMDVLR